MDKEQIKYNIYAFERDVRHFTRKRDAARTEHMRAKWQRRLDFAARCLADNQRWLTETETQ